MKKKILMLAGIAAVVAGVLLAVFAWKNLRGIGPAVTDPPADIARMIGRQGAGPLSLPPGFDLSVFASGLGKPRDLVVDPDGTLLVSIPSSGRVVALPDQNRDGVADNVVTVIDNLERPHGLAFRCAPECKLYIAEEGRVRVYSYNRKTFAARPGKKIANLPTGGFHTSRTLLFLPGQDTLLVSVGSSCNVCVEEDARRAAILAVPAEGGKASVFASGLRNAVFLAVNPHTSEIWATEMGRDLLGDDLPPDEINIVDQGGNYGWPYCYGKNVHDDEFDPGATHACRAPLTVPSLINIPAHSAPLGLAFFPASGWPPQFSRDLLVAYHGSWNRSIPTGYKIVRYRFDGNGKFLGKQDFATGWLTPDNRALGRPVDILIREDGNIFVSDDKAGVIYRIWRTG